MSKKKEEYNTTFGSDISDDRYYLEYRTPEDKVYSFLSFDIDTNNNIEVSIGRGAHAQKMPINVLKKIIQEAEDRLNTAMEEWKENYS